MGLLIMILAVIGVAALFAYLKFPPPYANPNLVSTFNKMVLGVAAFFCLIWFFYAYTTWKGSADDKWWLALAVFGCLGIEIGFLVVCFILRNFWIFKPPSRPGSGFFG